MPKIILISKSLKNIEKITFDIFFFLNMYIIYKVNSNLLQIQDKNK